MHRLQLNLYKNDQMNDHCNFKNKVQPSHLGTARIYVDKFIMKQTVQVIELPGDGQKDKNKNEKSPELELDTILSEIGGFGRYQFLVAICMGLMATYGAFVVLNFIFISPIPNHRLV